MYLLNFQNTHQAIRAEKILKQQLSIRVAPLPKNIGDSCGICIEVEEDSLDEALKLLEANQAAYLNVFKQQIEDGKKVYLPWN